MNTLLKYTIVAFTLCISTLATADISLTAPPAKTQETNFGQQAKVCVNKSGNRNMDRKLAFFEARKELATQVQLAAEIVTKGYQRQNRNNANKISNQTLEEKTSMVINQTLRGSYPIKQGYQQEYYCVTMVLKDPVNNINSLYQDITSTKITETTKQTYAQQAKEYVNNYKAVR